MRLFVGFLCFLVIQLSNCARILFVAPIPSYSHQIFYRKIWLDLAERGHDLTVLTTDVMKDAPKNVRQIDWSCTYDLRHKKHNISKVSIENDNNLGKLVDKFKDMLNDISEAQLSHPDVQKLLKNKEEKFDLLIVEYHHPLMFAFSHHFNCPFVGISSSEIADIYHDQFHNPTHPLLYPSAHFFHNTDISIFWDRVEIFKKWASMQFMYNRFLENPLSQKYFGVNSDLLWKLMSNVSVVLVNTHLYFDSRPLSPAVIRIGGGIHLDPIKPLPGDLSSFLDDSKEGVIYFSLGTNVRSASIDERLLKIFTSTLAELPFKVLWKFDAEVKNLTKNVKVVNWVPQPDVLRHKNIKLFITQAGLQSLEEAICSKVPMVAIPFVSDQSMNALKIKQKGLGLTLNHRDLTKEDFKKTILEVINNPTYKKNVQNAATYLQDQPISGLELAIWWIEYTIRHKGTKHLWDYNTQIPLYQYFFIDVITYLILLYTIPTIIILILLWKIVRKFVKTPKEKTL